MSFVVGQRESIFSCDAPTSGTTPEGKSRALGRQQDKHPGGVCVACSGGYYLRALVHRTVSVAAAVTLGLVAAPQPRARQSPRRERQSTTDAGVPFRPRPPPPRPTGRSCRNASQSPTVPESRWPMNAASPGIRSTARPLAIRSPRTSSRGRRGSPAHYPDRR